MTALTLELATDLMERLQIEAARLGKPAEVLVGEWLTAHLTPIPPLSERERAREVLRAAGLLTELGPELKRRAAESTASLEEVSAALSRAGGKPLSEMVIEQRGPKG